jgi:hypothetical protein
MRLEVFKLASAVEVLLVVVEGCLHLTWLPFGGGHVQQLGVVFGVAHAINEIGEANSRRNNTAAELVERRL